PALAQGNQQTGAKPMAYQAKPMPFDPKSISGISEKVLVSHYDNNYVGAVKRLNAIGTQLAELDFAKAPNFVINGLKREELIASNSMILHEIYFDGLGGGGSLKGPLIEAIVRDFGSMERWRAEFSAMGKAEGGGSGWVILSYSPRDKRLVNQWAADHTTTLAGGRPALPPRNMSTSTWKRSNGTMPQNCTTTTAGTPSCIATANGDQVMTTTTTTEPGRIGELVRYFLRLGCLGFGGPVALVGQMERELVDGKKWLTREQMREAIAICQSLPGPLAIQVGVYISYLRGGFWGAWAGGWAFILPNFIIVAALGALYVYLGDLQPVTAVFYGVSPAVIALILHSCYRLAKLGMEDWLQWAIAAVCFAVTIILQAEVALL